MTSDGTRRYACPGNGLWAKNFFFLVDEWSGRRADSLASLLRVWSALRVPPSPELLESDAPCQPLRRSRKCAGETPVAKDRAGVGTLDPVALDPHWRLDLVTREII